MQPTAFKNFIQLISNKLYLTALRLVVNREDAKDIVQEAIIKLWEIRDQIEELENAEGYAMKIVINKSLDWLKKNKPIYMDIQDYMVPSYSEDSHKQLHYKEQLNTIHHLVQRMSPVQKAIFELREIQGKSYKEIAEVLNIEMSKVKVNLHRIRKKLKEHCEALERYGIAKN